LRENTQQAWFWVLFAGTLLLLFMDVWYLIMTCRISCTTRPWFHRWATWYINTQTFIRTVLFWLGYVSNIAGKLSPEVWASVKSVVRGMALAQVFLEPIGWTILFIMAGFMIGTHQRIFAFGTGLRLAGVDPDAPAAQPLLDCTSREGSAIADVETPDKLPSEDFAFGGAGGSSSSDASKRD
jgi:hypothetical protein